MNNFIQLSDNILKTYGQNSLLPLALVLKKQLLNNKYDLQFNYIYEILGIDRRSSYRQKVRDIFVAMQKDGVIVCDDDLSTISVNRLVEVGYNMPEGKFTQIDYVDIDKIIAYQGNESKYNIFNLFWAIKSHLYTPDTVWTIEYQTLKDMTEIKHNDTIRGIVAILGDLKLIIKDNVGYRLFWDGQIKNSSYTFANSGNYEGLNTEIAQRREQLAENNIEIRKKKKIYDPDITTNKPANNVLVGRGSKSFADNKEVMAGFSLSEDSTDKKVMAIDTFHEDGTITCVEDIINDSKFIKIIQMFAQKHNKKINSIISFVEDLEDYFISDDFTGLSKTEQYEEFNEILKINESDIDDITNTDSNINYLIG